MLEITKVERKEVERIISVFTNKFVPVYRTFYFDEEIKREIEEELFKIVDDIYTRGWEDAQ